VVLVESRILPVPVWIKKRENQISIFAAILALQVILDLVVGKPGFNFEGIIQLIHGELLIRANFQ
jgi:hypothetical protein